MKKQAKNKSIERVDLTTLTSPTELKTLSKKQLTMLASDVRKEIINATAQYGGHLSSNLGVVEATIALHRVFDFRYDKLLFDVGHQAYAHKLLTGRKLEGLRQKDGISGFQKRAESPYDQFEAGHSSTAISSALGMSVARDLNGEHYQIVAFVGDASITNGLSFEALNHAHQLESKIIVVLNDNEMSITQPVGSMSRLFRKWKMSPRYLKSKNLYKRIMFTTRVGYFLYRCTWRLKNFIKRHLLPSNVFEQMGFNYIGPIDGHDLKQLEKALTQAKLSPRSTIVHINTTKGKGYQYSEGDCDGSWHGVSPFEVETGKAKKVNPQLSWSEVYAKKALALLDEDPNTVVITPATLKGAALDEVFSKHPARAIDCGIAEMHAFSLATGLALNKKLPIISVYSTFMQRAFDQVIHDLARMKLPSIILVDRAGFVGADGETHQGLYDEAFLLNVPDVIVAMASRLEIAQTLINLAHTTDRPFFIRYPREFVTYETVAPLSFQVGDWLNEQTGTKKDVAVVTFGPLIEQLKAKIDEEVTLVNAIFQKPINDINVENLLAFKTIIIADAYATHHGFVQGLTALLVNKGYKGKIIGHAANDQFIEQATIEQQRQDSHVDLTTLLNVINEEIKHAR